MSGNSPGLTACEWSNGDEQRRWPAARGPTPGAIRKRSGQCRRFIPRCHREWLLQRIEELEQTIDERCALILEVLFEKATELKADFTEAMLRERRRHPPSERGCVGLRVRTAATSAAGMFQIEWYRVLGKRRTRYLRRGKDQQGRPRMQYSLSAFGRITLWERSLILEYEPQCARLRAMQHHIGRLRRAAGPVSGEYRALLALADSSKDRARTKHA